MNLKEYLTKDRIPFLSSLPINLTSGEVEELYRVI